MTGNDVLDRTLSDWLEAEALSPIPSGRLDQVLDATRRRSPRPAWLARVGSHWIGGTGSSSSLQSPPRVGPSWSTALILLAVLALLVAGALLAGSRFLRLSQDARLAHLVYVLDDDIYVADWDGANPLRIVDGESVGTCHDLVELDGLVSPDGRHVAYRSNWGDGCDGRVIITDLAGNLVASFPGEGRGVAWSPDSTRVATWLTTRGPTIGIYGVDSVRQTVLDGSRACCDQDFSRPDWSRDGASLMIRRHRDDPVMPNVWELPVNGDPARPVPEDDPRWSMVFPWIGTPSPDGTRVAFVQDVADGWVVVSTALVVTSMDGTQRHALVDLDRSDLEDGLQIGNIVWSPLGDRIAYTRGRRGRDLYHDADGNPTLLTIDLWVVDPTTGTTSVLATGRGPESLQPLGFSPIGDRILYAQTDEGGGDSLWSVTTDGLGVPTMVAVIDRQGRGSIARLGSSPDGARILVGRTDEDGAPGSIGSLWSANTDGSAARMLVAGTNVGRWLTEGRPTWADH